MVWSCLLREGRTSFKWRLGAAISGCRGLPISPPSRRRHRPVRVIPIGSLARMIISGLMALVTRNRPLGILRGITITGARTAAWTMRPVVSAATHVGMGLERQTMEMLGAGEKLERMANSPTVGVVADEVLASEAASRIVEAFFDSGLFDELVDRLLVSDALWRLIDTVAASPAVRAAIARQGLGFADEVGDQVRTRTRGADDWLTARARRLLRRGDGSAPTVQTPGP